MPLQARPRPGLRTRHQAFQQEMSSSSSIQMKAAVPDKRPKVDEEVQTNGIKEHLKETKDELDRRVRKTLIRTEEDRDMWRRLSDDCNKKQGDEIELLRQEYKERSD